MKKLVTGVLALTLSVSLTACSKGEGTGSSASTSSSAADASGASSSTLPTDSTSSGASTAAVDQSTPELAMTSWLNAMVAGDASNVCGLMAIKGRPIATISGAAEACTTRIAPELAQIKQLGGAFAGLTIKGATVNGNNATFESVTTEPAMAADVVASFKAVKVGDKWYVTEG